MKRMLAGLLTLCLLAALAVPCLAAESGGVVQTVKALGILTGDESGNTDLYGAVGRAEFASMLAAASAYKDSVSREGSGYSLYKDVKSGYWASEAIQLAVRQGWMTGYTDRTFRPEQAVTLEEACTALLKLLGYDASSLAGSFPQAQLSKASALGLRDGVSTQRGQSLTRQDCAYLFYNLLTAKTGGGQVYGESLGYTVSNGEVDYTSVALDNISGPYVAESNYENLPFEPATIYKNGKEVSSYSILRGNIYYYSEGAKTVWIYTTQVTGKIEAISPSLTSPTSVKISGKTYEIGSASASYKLSAAGGGGTGKVITLLLGMNDAVVDVLAGNAVDTIYYGVIDSVSEVVDDEKATVQKELTVICTDGEARTFAVDGKLYFGKGALVSASITEDGTSVERIKRQTASGKVSEDITTFGDYHLASDVQILDISEKGAVAVISPDRLAGRTLKKEDVLHYTKNQNDEIDRLILNDATGDIWSYGYLISVREVWREKESEESSSFISDYIYTYMLDGDIIEWDSGSPTEQYHVEGGSGVAISFDIDGTIIDMMNTESVQLTKLGALTAWAENRAFALSDNLQVFLKKDGTYYPAEYESIHPEEHKLTGLYDEFSAGGQIRVILAEKK